MTEITLEATYRQRYLSRANGMFLAALGVHIPVFVVVALVMHTSVVQAIVFGAAIFAGPAILYMLQPGGRVTVVGISAATMAMSALLIHLGRGMIEMHFHIFVGLGSLILLA